MSLYAYKIYSALHFHLYKRATRVLTGTSQVMDFFQIHLQLKNKITHN